MVALINTLLTQLAAVLRGSGVEAMGKHRRVMMRGEEEPSSAPATHCHTAAVRVRWTSHLPGSDQILPSSFFS